jgi:hypothetical protein
MGLSRWSRKTASVSNEARRAVVAALIELAGSPDYRDRADAGRGLASFAEMPEARGPLLELALDDRDTFVTRVTAEPCFGVKTQPGSRWSPRRSPLSALTIPTMLTGFTPLC